MDLETQRYKEQIDKDLKDFRITKRFLQLEKSWIINISHKVFPCQQNGVTFFTHQDRKKLRKELLKYLNSKLKKSHIRNKEELLLKDIE